MKYQESKTITFTLSAISEEFKAFFVNILVQNFTTADGAGTILILQTEMNERLEVFGLLASFLYVSFPKPNGQGHIFKAVSLDAQAVLDLPGL